MRVEATSRQPTSTQRTWPVVLAILALALGLRLWGLTFGLPYAMQPDEASVIDRTMTMWVTGDLDPHYLTYPSLFYYMQAGWQDAAGHIVGLVHPGLLKNPTIFTPSATAQPFYYGASRVLTALLGTLAVLMTYLAGRWLSVRIGIFAALFLAVAAIHVQQSHYATVDATTALFTASAAFFALGMLARDRNSFSIMLLGSSISAGLAAGTKYNAGLAIAMPLAVVILFGSSPVSRRLIVGLGACTSCALTFLLTTPFALLDQSLLKASLQSVFQHYTGGHAGAEGNDAVAWYVQDLVTRGIGLPMTLLALAGVPLVVFRFRAQGVVLLTFVIPYYALLCSTIVRFDRNLMPILPFIALLAACTSDTALTWLGRWQWIGRMSMRWREYAGCLLVLAIVAGPSLYIAAYGDQLSDYALAHRFTEDVAAQWATSHLPAHAMIATENWEGRVFDTSPRHFNIHWTSSLGNVPFSSLVQQGVRFVISDSYTRGEYEGDARRFPVQAARYRALDEKAKVLVVIQGDGQARPGPDMTIYQMP